MVPEGEADRIDKHFQCSPLFGLWKGMNGGQGGINDKTLAQAKPVYYLSSG